MIKWSTDSALADRIIKDPKVWPWVSDDRHDVNSFSFPEIDGSGIRMALCYNDDNLCGCFFLFEQSPKVTEIHTCLLVHGLAKSFGDQVIDRIFKDTDYDAISTTVPVDNPAARKLAIKCGFTFDGMAESIRKQGLTVDVERWRLNKCQQ